MNTPKEEYLKYLDNLRESCITNMLGATPFLRDHYPELSEREAREILVYWIKTFGKEEGE